MTDPKTPQQLPAKDRLVTRPEEVLPAAQDPRERGTPADPKPDPGGGQGEDPHAGDLGHTA
jgi:hypothetical protein